MWAMKLKDINEKFTVVTLGRNTGTAKSKGLVSTSQF